MINQKFFVARILIFSFLVSGIFFNCGKTPSDIPPPQTGSLRIVSQIDTVLADSINVWIDDINYGLQRNPSLIDDIVSGTHLVSVAREDTGSPIDYSCIPKLVEVKRNRIKEVDIPLTKFAPDFSLPNLQGQQINMEDYRGKVLLLFFYTYT